MISRPGSRLFDAPELAVPERCQGVCTHFLMHGSSSAARAGSILPHAQLDRGEALVESILQWIAGRFRGSGIKGWNAAAINMLYLTLKIYLILNSSTRLYLCLWH